MFCNQLVGSQKRMIIFVSHYTFSSYFISGGDSDFRDIVKSPFFYVTIITVTVVIVILLILLRRKFNGELS